MKRNIISAVSVTLLGLSLIFTATPAIAKANNSKMTASAKVRANTLKTQMVQYKDGNQILEGYLAYSPNLKGKRPGVLIVHDWLGMGPNPKMRADMLAKMGYIAFAADIYGKSVKADTPKAASALAGKYKSDIPLMRSRVIAGYNVLKNNPLTNTVKIAAIGYCFGGTTALELARSGAQLAGVAIFHGGLATKTPDDAKNIKGKVLVLHGADDPNVPPKEVMAFQDEMRNAKIDWEMIAYGNAVHAFTIKSAGNDNSKGAAYNEKADKRSWQAMKDFFAEIF